MTWIPLIFCLLVFSRSTFGRSTYGPSSEVPSTNTNLNDKHDAGMQSKVFWQQSFVQNIPPPEHNYPQQSYNATRVSSSWTHVSHQNISKLLTNNSGQQFAQSQQIFSHERQRVVAPQFIHEKQQSVVYPSTFDGSQKSSVEQQQNLQTNAQRIHRLKEAGDIVLSCIQSCNYVSALDVLCRGKQKGSIITIGDKSRFVVCLDYGRGVEQHCPKGLYYHHESRRCEHRFRISETACNRQPCLNDGRCIAINITSYTCQCQLGFGGDNCELDIRVCQTEQPCGQASDQQCQSFRAGAALSYICIFRSGLFYGFSPRDLQPNPCKTVSGPVALDKNDKGFIVCDHGFMFIQSCPGGTVWDDAKKACVWADIKGFESELSIDETKSQQISTDMKQQKTAVSSTNYVVQKQTPEQWYTEHTAWYTTPNMQSTGSDQQTRLSQQMESSKQFMSNQQTESSKQFMSNQQQKQDHQEKSSEQMSQSHIPQRASSFQENEHVPFSVPEKSEKNENTPSPDVSVVPTPQQHQELQPITESLSVAKSETQQQSSETHETENKLTHIFQSSTITPTEAEKIEHNTSLESSRQTQQQHQATRFSQLLKESAQMEEAERQRHLLMLQQAQKQTLAQSQQQETRQNAEGLALQHGTQEHQYISDDSMTQSEPEHNQQKTNELSPISQEHLEQQYKTQQQSSQPHSFPTTTASQLSHQNDLLNSQTEAHETSKQLHSAEHSDFSQQTSTAAKESTTTSHVSGHETMKVEQSELQEQPNSAQQDKEQPSVAIQQQQNTDQFTGYQSSASSLQQSAENQLYYRPQQNAQRQFSFPPQLQGYPIPDTLPFAPVDQQQPRFPPSNQPNAQQSEQTQRYEFPQQTSSSQQQLTSGAAIAAQETAKVEQPVWPQQSTSAQQTQEQLYVAAQQKQQHKVHKFTGYQPSASSQKQFHPPPQLQGYPIPDTLPLAPVDQQQPQFPPSNQPNAQQSEETQRYEFPQQTSSSQQQLTSGAAIAAQETAKVEQPVWPQQSTSAQQTQEQLYVAAQQKQQHKVHKFTGYQPSASSQKQFHPPPQLQGYPIPDTLPLAPVDQQQPQFPPSNRPDAQQSEQTQRYEFTHHTSSSKPQLTSGGAIAAQETAKVEQPVWPQQSTSAQQTQEQLYVAAQQKQQQNIDQFTGYQSSASSLQQFAKNQLYYHPQQNAQQQILPSAQLQGYPIPDTLPFAPVDQQQPQYPPSNQPNAQQSEQTQRYEFTHHTSSSKPQLTSGGAIAAQETAKVEQPVWPQQSTSAQQTQEQLYVAAQQKQQQNIDQFTGYQSSASSQQQFAENQLYYHPQQNAQQQILPSAQLQGYPIPDTLPFAPVDQQQPQFPPSNQPNAQQSEQTQRYEFAQQTSSSQQQLTSGAAIAAQETAKIEQPELPQQSTSFQREKEQQSVSTHQQQNRDQFAAYQPAVSSLEGVAEYSRLYSPVEQSLNAQQLESLRTWQNYGRQGSWNGEKNTQLLQSGSLEQGRERQYRLLEQFWTPQWQWTKPSVVEPIGPVPVTPAGQQGLEREFLFSQNWKQPEKSEAMQISQAPPVSEERYQTLQNPTTHDQYKNYPYYSSFSSEANQQSNERLQGISGQLYSIPQYETIQKYENYWNREKDQPKEQYQSSQESIWPSSAGSQLRVAFYPWVQLNQYTENDQSSMQ